MKTTCNVANNNGCVWEREQRFFLLQQLQQRMQHGKREHVRKRRKNPLLHAWLPDCVVHLLSIVYEWKPHSMWLDLGTLLSCTLDIDSCQLVRKLLIIFMPFAINSISVTIRQTLFALWKTKKRKRKHWEHYFVLSQVQLKSFSSSGNVDLETLSTIFQLLHNTLVTLWSDFMHYNQVDVIDF